VSDIKNLVVQLAHEAKAAARRLAFAEAAQKNKVLERVATLLLAESSKAKGEPGVLEANLRDLEQAQKRGLSGAMLDRLKLDGPRLAGVAAAVSDIVHLTDPIGRVADLRKLENGLQVGRMRVPLGLIAMIYEARPNVTIEAAALCVKSGNACILRGGSEAFHTNTALAAVFQQALAECDVAKATVTLIPVTDREATLHLIGLAGVVDLVIPRGGESLIQFVTENARVPVIQHYKGVCHVYVDGDADLEMAESIAFNAKVQRPGVCNAMESLLIDRACVDAFLPRMAARFAEARVQIRGDAEVCKRIASAQPASDADWDTEYLDLIVSVAVVDGIDGALEHVSKHGSYHTESIVTRSYARAQRWLREVDASLVLVNASTRFNDGGQLGLGSEIGISTTKLHAYGPMGLEELCTQKWIGLGDGQVRT